ncbi:MAG: helix-turn-helix transcriptional regulator [Pseudomonadota bacterium]
MVHASSVSRFGRLLRSWRRTRRWSQLDLAVECDVSQRHISFLESGRADPSRAMINRLAEGLELPLRERNQLYLAAGFAARFEESALDDTLMQPIRGALEQMLAHHEPFPAIVLNRHWDVVRKNDAAAALFSAAIGERPHWIARALDGQLNLFELVFHPAGIQPLIRNWDEVGPALLTRARREVGQHGSETLSRFLSELPDHQPELDASEHQSALLPILPLQLVLGEHTLSFFSVISTFGTPLDITTDELRVECFFPNDAPTEAFFQQHA